jgi:hypothetical protein
MPRKTPPTIAVSRRALVGRVERALRRMHQQLRTDRSGRGLAYVVIDSKRQAIVEVNVDLDKLARRLKVLHPWERMANG